MQRKIPGNHLILALLFIFIAEAPPAAVQKLPERYKTWLEEEVFYIISPREKSVFQQLNSDRERDLFIEAFWNQRDPTPNSPTNEFKQEHYRRINYANQFFGRSTAKPGWRTDRGRIYIILGEPRDILRTSERSELHPTETWFYQGLTQLGLPPAFHLIFYRRGATGEYRLYSPLVDGPQMLMTQYRGDPRDYITANQALKELDSELAEFTLSLITGDQTTTLGRPSMASDMLVERVENTPQRQIKDIYAQKFLEYKDVIDVEYSAKYIYSDALVKVTKNPNGAYFVSYALQPERLSVNQYQDSYYTTLKLNGTISNSAGKTLYQYEKNVRLEFDETQMRDFSHRTFSLQDMIPVIPGSLKLSVLLQNEVSKEFTSLERDLLIPDEQNGLQMTSLIIGYEKRAGGDRIRPFQNGSNQILFQANRVFAQKDDLWISFQIHGVTQTLWDRGELRFRVMREQEEVLAFARKVRDVQGLPNVLERIILKELPPAHYELHVSLNLENREVLTENEEFDVTHVESIPRPWLYTRALPDLNDPIFDFTLGTQYHNNGQYQEARRLLDRAFQKNPQSLDIAMQLSQTLLELKEYTTVEFVLKPFTDLPEPTGFQAYLTLGAAYRALGRLDEAVDILDKSLRLNGLNPLTLNAVGDCYIDLGNYAEALKALEKSLEMETQQTTIKAKVEELRKKFPAFLTNSGTSPGKII